jgi:hypothetical protein
MSSLAQKKCFNHAQREAVARCPGCKRDFCRECVSEHDNKLLCTSCLSAIDAPQESARRTFSFLIPAAQLFIGLFILWISFYVLGNVLLFIPTDFHATWLNP